MSFFSLLEIIYYVITVYNLSKVLFFCSILRYSHENDHLMYSFVTGFTYVHSEATDRHVVASPVCCFDSVCAC